MEKIIKKYWFEFYMIVGFCIIIILAIMIIIEQINTIEILNEIIK